MTNQEKKHDANMLMDLEMMDAIVGGGECQSCSVGCQSCPQICQSCQTCQSEQTGKTDPPTPEPTKEPPVGPPDLIELDDYATPLSGKVRI